MTVGEKIQTYRKNLSLSQEELGKKVLVSRQTISLWEKGQTLPTIDNLMRLKEIFGVSVDEILDIESGSKIQEEIPTETYKFSFSQDEVDEIYKLQRFGFYKKTIIFVLVSVFLILYFISSSEPGFMIGFAYCMLLIGSISLIKDIFAYRKAWKNSKEKICLSVYEYKIFRDYLLINIYRKNEKVRIFKCYFSDIERIQSVGGYIFFQNGGQSFIVKKSDLKENSFFYSYMYNNPAKTIQQITPDKWRVSSIILFVASLLSVLGALVLVGAVSNVNNLFVENMWLFFLLTPIPIASTVFGFILKSKGYKYKKNIVAGIIMTILLCIYGSFSIML